MPTNPNRAFKDRDLPVLRHEMLITGAQNAEIISYMLSYSLMWSDVVVPALGSLIHRSHLVYPQAETVIRYLEDTYADG